MDLLEAFGNSGDLQAFNTGTVIMQEGTEGNVMYVVIEGEVTISPMTALVDEKLCSGCKSCIPLCPYTAISFAEEERKAVINEALCKGCGTCVASCPSGSIVQRLFGDEEIFSEIRGVLAAG